MKRKFFFMLVALLATVTVQAQQIAVVAEDGTTNMYRTLQEAIEGAPNGSVVYLPGGGFTISNEVKITKKLTIIGIGHKANGDNVDGKTTIGGNLFFNKGSDGSAVMGCYISGNVEIAESGVDYAVNDITIKLCNINSIQVRDKDCIGIFVNQNYIRNNSNCGNAPVIISNNVMHSLVGVNGGTINNNFFTYWGDAYTGSLNNIYNSVISGNVIACLWVGNFGGWADFDGTAFYGNFHHDEYGEKCILAIGGWEDIFVNWHYSDYESTVSSAFNYHFKEAYQQYESLCGIYAGTGFDDSQLPPVPYISSKSIPGETDASGKLHIQVTVNAK